MIGHQTIAEQAKRIALLGLADGLEKRDAVGIVSKYLCAVIAAIERMVNKAVIKARGRRPMVFKITADAWIVKKNELTPIIAGVRTGTVHVEQSFAGIGREPATRNHRTDCGFGA